jgi:N-acetylmuramic acid 6-phosphate etherase
MAAEDRDRPLTETVHPRADSLDEVPTAELLAVMHEEDRQVPDAVGTQLAPIATLVDEVIRRLRRGGVLHYFGAGTSGRLGVLDAAECPPTFGVPETLVRAHLAGGPEAVTRAVEGAEDDAAGGQREARATVGSGDAVLGLAAGGETQYVRGAVAAARELGAYTAALVCTRGSGLARDAEVAIEVPLGPEVVAGATRLKAGTAQKLVLNMVSTAALWRLGHVYRGRMVDVRVTNAKLRGRAVRTVAELAGAPEPAAAAALATAGAVKPAVVMLALGVDEAVATDRLQAAGGDLRQVLRGAERA